MVRATIIAEAGVNHNGDLALAMRLVDAAADAGADIVKFQTFKADRMVTSRAPKADYQKDVTASAESHQEMLRRLELSREAHEALIAQSRSRGIEFLSSGFDEESVDLLVELGVKTLKIPSGEITNLPYLRHVGRQSKPVILSTGMADVEEIKAAIHVLEQAGTPRSRITVLHCTTEYPTPMPDVNLSAMTAMRDAFGVAVGYSDHTEGIEVAIAAVSLGATVIEKHFTLDRSLPGPDHKASLEPAELKEMVAAIRNIEQAMGSGVKTPAAGELKNRVVARKSLVAARPISAGQQFDATNLAAKRPGSGISPMRWDEVVGKKAKRDFAADEPIEL